MNAATHFSPLELAAAAALDVPNEFIRTLQSALLLRPRSVLGPSFLPRRAA